MTGRKRGRPRKKKPEDGGSGPVVVVTGVNTNTGEMNFLGCHVGPGCTGIRYFQSNLPEHVDYRLYYGDVDAIPKLMETQSSVLEHFTGKGVDPFWAKPVLVPLELAKKLAPHAEFVLH